MKRLPVLVLATVIVCLFGFCADHAGAGTTWYVDDDAPADFATIQAAIDAAFHGDTIVVRDGLYAGDGNRNIDLKGKAVHVMSENAPENCIIDCQQMGRGFYFHSYEEQDSIVDGFTITNAYASYGAGIYFSGTTATAMNNIITGNTSGGGKYYGGGGIRVKAGWPTIINNVITGNNDLQSGGGIRCVAGGAPVIAYNTIGSNTAAIYGGGIYCDGGSSPAITDNVIIANTALHGGGISRDVASPIITGNVIGGNTVESVGGGILCNNSSPMVSGNALYDNVANNGGALSYDSSGGVLANNTITGNTAWNRGGTINCGGSSSMTIKNSVLWDNVSPRGPEIALISPPTTLTVMYSDVAGGWGVASVPDGCTLIWGPGNIDTNPIFADPGNGDYHLKSNYGRWDPTANGGAGGWVFDDMTSPCIGAGDPGSDAANEPQPNGGIINMGGCGNTLEASKSEWILGDVTGDCVVNVLDAINVRNHLYEPVGSGDNWRYDLNGDGMINVLDMLVVRNNARARCE